MHSHLHELEQISGALLASENWAPTYAKAPVQHAALIKNGAKLQRLVLVYLRDLAKMAPQLINWHNYSSALYEQQRQLQATGSVQAYDINVIVNNDVVNQQDQTFIKLVFDTVATIQALGTDSMEEEFGFPIGLDSTSSIIQDLTTDQLANLVGMKVDKETGHIVPNPNPEFSIDETTRGRIAQSIKTSIRLGEDHQAAVKRLQTVIADAKRADMIAYTETVRAYAEGRHTYATQSGAVAKRWYDSNATDVCADNTAQGWIPFGDDFISGDEEEPAHPHCKCQTIYSYDKADLIDAGLNDAGTNLGDFAGE